MFRTVSLSIISSFSLHTQQWYMSYRFADSLRIQRTVQLASCQQTLQRAGLGRNWIRPDPARKLSANLYDINHCCVCSAKLLMMDRGTLRKM